MPKIIHNFFTQDECRSAIEEVYQHEDKWYQCKQTDMYILGNSLFRNATISDTGINYGNYFNNNTYNLNASKLFKDKLSTLFPTVEFTKNFGKPGFQIIKRNETSTPSVWHYDNVLVLFPYEKEFKNYTMDFSKYFDEYYIFTLMVSNGEASFDYFPQTESSFGKDIYDACCNTPICKKHVNLIGDSCDCSLTEFNTIEYQQGTLLIQNERVLHRVGNRDINGSIDPRITLQTYGVVKDNILYLLW